MTAPRPTALLQPVDDAVRAQLRALLRTATHAALSTLDPADGWPQASRVALATDCDGSPLLLTSALTPHSAAMTADARCALLVGEAGRGDPLAHPRLSLNGRALRVERGSVAHTRIRQRFLARQPKAALYADFGDFSFWRVEPERASLNGGFGRAYALEPADLLSPVADPDAFEASASAAAAACNRDHADALMRLAGTDAPAELVTLDPHGAELRSDGRLLRIEWARPVTDPAQLTDALRARLA